MTDEEDTVGFLPPPPELTRLRKQVHTRDDGSRSLTVSFLVNTQQLLLADFEAAAHDAMLRHAHADGHMPVGPFLITTEPASSEQLGHPCLVCEGRGEFLGDKCTAEGCVNGNVKDEQHAGRLKSIDELQIENAILMGDLVQVTGTVELGLSLL